MDIRADKQAFGIACIWALRGRNRLTGLLRVLALAGDKISNAGGDAGWLSCSNRGCLGLSELAL